MFEFLGEVVGPPTKCDEIFTKDSYHECMVAILCKHFVMIGLVMFKLYVFEFLSFTRSRFQVSFTLHKFYFWGLSKMSFLGVWLRKFRETSIRLQEAYLCVEWRVLSTCLSRSDTPYIVYIYIYIHIHTAFPVGENAGKFGVPAPNLTSHGGWCPRRNHVCQVSNWNLHGLRFYRGSNFRFSCWF